MHVLLTGASSGIGAALASHFGDLGWKQTLVARRENLLNEVAESIDAPTFVRPADLSSSADLQSLFEDARAQHGPIDILVNNAGVQYVQPAVSVTEDQTELIFNVNLIVPMHLTRIALGEMLERRSGTIVNIASMAGITPTPGMCHYNATKSGLGAASESLRVELKNSGVHVFTVYPGPVHSPMEAEARKNIQQSWIANAAPTGDPETLARLISKGIAKKQARLIYPRFYAMARYNRVFSQWVTDTFTPPLRIEE